MLWVFEETPNLSRKYARGERNLKKAFLRIDDICDEILEPFM